MFAPAYIAVAIRHSNYVHRVTSEVGVSFLSPIFLVVQIQLVQLLVGLLVRLLVGKSYHTKQKDGYSLLSNNPTDNRTNWIRMTKKIGLNLNGPPSLP